MKPFSGGRRGFESPNRFSSAPRLAFAAQEIDGFFMQNRTVNAPNRNLNNTTKPGIQKSTAEERVLADEIAADATSQAPAAKTVPSGESAGTPVRKPKP